MTNSKLTKLSKYSGEILAMYQTHSNDVSIEVTPFMEQSEPGSEVVTIHFKNTSVFNWKFLEPLSKFCINKNLFWEIYFEDNDLFLNIEL
jgi:hypothetical protein